MPDPELLDRARARKRVLSSMDDDLLVAAADRLASGTGFAGLIYARPLRITIGQAVRDLKLMAEVLDPADMLNHVERLPL